MNQVFVDSNGWIALNSKRDYLHQKTVEANRTRLNGGNRYLTTNFVLDETYSGLLTKVGHFAAVDFGERIRKSKTVRVLRISEQIEEDAWTLFKKYSDKEFSFTDCTSFEVMQQFKITEAFTNDHHFEQMGFQILLKVPK
ncbi:PIN domain-containing protein [candidate division KSB1 bacterium]|nr:PIN domain-containing protein [candidate division KSB1 bacterium]NIR69869.1 PIN domain-containing protein [candidate division KSB1 bacterium]NIS22988.1 PIN domain-containing protein [candidate division KSB1 bacterium]NIT69846.1 PIN domain-containing protein [candidate division KSB1 bacterium]NIU25768.1 PIN domain-containing protein [candidate division KSB1 bacterium]